MEQSKTDHDFYTYNALGELVAQTDAKDNYAATGPTVTMEYDLLGRMVERIEAEGTSTWLYDFDPNATPTAETYADGQAAHSIGKLIEVTGAEGETKRYTFDSLGRKARVRSCFLLFVLALIKIAEQ